MVAMAVDSTDIQAARREFLDKFNAEAKAQSDFAKISTDLGCSRCDGSIHHLERSISVLEPP